MEKKLGSARGRQATVDALFGNEHYPIWCLNQYIGQCVGHYSIKSVLSVRFEVGVSLLLAPVGADKRGPKAPFPLVENARIQPVTCKRVPAGAPAGAGSY